MSSQPIGPASVPALAARHQDDLLDPRYQDYAGAFMRGLLGTIPDDLHDEVVKRNESLRQASSRLGRNWCQAEADFLNITTLFHVTEPMLAVAKSSAMKMPEDEQWNVDDFPSRTGFMIFEKPLKVRDIRGLIQCFNAVSWHFAPPSAPGDPQVIEFNYYTDNDDPGDEINRINEEHGYRAPGRFSLSHAMGVHLGMTIGPYTLPMDDARRAKYLSEHPSDTDIETYLAEAKPQLAVDYAIQELNLALIVYSVFALMQQSLADLSDYTDKRLARRIRGKRRPPPIVTVIRLRHPEQFGAREEGTGTWLTYRSLTRAHWRRQHYADGTVKRIFINAYWRGPENAPFYQPQRVTSLQR